jgi:predicted metal-dependent phosphoesterase TrpH
MVDLHSHTDRSDGLLSPRELVDLACEKGLRALAITDHDSLEGYDEAAPYARRRGLELICGIELNSKFHDRAIHILGYFLDGPANQDFRGHLSCLQQARRERNTRLAQRLQGLGLDVRLEDAEAIGRSQTGRPHFAQALVRKGYVADMREAFDRYLDEGQPGYVERRDASLENVIGWIRQGGGISCWAHPARFIRRAGISAEILFRGLAAKGLSAIEVHHRDHLPEETCQFKALTEKLGLGKTGGSDFHSPIDCAVPLGGLSLPYSLLQDLKAYSQTLLSAGGNRRA